VYGQRPTQFTGINFVETPMAQTDNANIYGLLKNYEPEKS